MTDTAALMRILRAVAVQHLPGAPAVPWPAWDGPDTASVAEALVSLAEAKRLLGPLHLAAVSAATPLPADAMECLVRRHRAAMAWCVHLEMRLLEVRDAFDSAGGVDHLTLKGVAVSHLDEIDPSMRSFADVDLLVPGRHLDRAVAVLASLGATRPWPERRPGYDRRFAKSVTMTMADGVQFDLHRTLCDGVHGVRIPSAELFADAEQFALGGETIAALARPHRMLHAAYHAALGSAEPPLLSLRDLARYMTAADLSPDVVVPVACRWRGEAVLSVAVQATRDALAFAAPAWQRWLATAEVDPRELALVERLRRVGSSFGPAAVDLLRELPGIHDRFAYARAVLWPASAHLRARGLRRSDPWKALLRSRRSR